MDTVRLGEILAYRLREHLGARVDYNATIMPNELAIYVEMIQPEDLRGLTFTFRENEPLPAPILRLRHGDPNTVRFTYQPDPAQFITLQANPLAYDIETRNVRENPVMATVMRTREQEARLADLERMWATVIMTQAQIQERRALMNMSAYRPPTPVIPTRTPAQEDRLRDLNEAGNHRAWTLEESREYDTLHQMANCPSPNPPRIYVRVHREDGRGGWDVSVRVGQESRDLPPTSVIKSLLNPADKHWLTGRQGRRMSTLRLLRNALEAGLPAQSLHDALRAWAMANENRISTVESVMPIGGIDAETANLLRAQPATLEVGGRVFRLTPIHEVDMRPLITRTRQRAIATAQVEVTAMTERARTDARVMTTEAERSASRIRADAENAARVAGARVPNWIRDSGRQHYWDRQYWCVRLSIGCLIRDIRLYVSEWGTTLHWKPIYPVHNMEWYQDRRIWAWLRVNENGGWDKHSVFTREDEYTTPHIDSFMCMDLQSQPRLVNNMDSLNALEATLTRGMQVINLNSPLSREVPRYFPEIRDQMPSVPAKIMIGTYAVRGNRLSMADWKAANPTITWDSEETIAQENSGTFSVGDPVPTLPIPPPNLAMDEILENARAIAAEAGLAVAIPQRRT